jgi:hypothetical protein
MLSNQNNVVLNSIKNVIAQCDRDMIEAGDLTFIHHSVPARYLFQEAAQRGVVLVEKLPPKTRRGKESIQGRVCTFFTECLEEMDTQRGSKKRVYLANSSRTHRGIDPAEVGMFTSIVRGKLGI